VPLVHLAQSVLPYPLAAAALLDELFEHPAGYSSVANNLWAIGSPACHNIFSRSPLAGCVQTCPHSRSLPSVNPYPELICAGLAWHPSCGNIMASICWNG